MCLRVPAGVNGAGKTTQLQIVMGRLQPDSGEVIKAKRHMKIAYLAQVGGLCVGGVDSYGGQLGRGAIWGGGQARVEGA